MDALLLGFFPHLRRPKARLNFPNVRLAQVVHT